MRSGRARGGPRSLLAKTILAGASALAALAVAEVGLRLLVDVPNTHHRVFCEHDPLLGWRNIPGGSGWHVTEEYRVLERFNSRGVRGPEYSLEKPAGTYRVLMLGDSFVEGFGVEYEELHSAQLAVRLQAELGRPVEVVNAGTAGYATDQEVLFFETEGHRYQPDLTVLVFYENDPLYNTVPRTHRGDKPLFVADAAGELQLTNVPVPAPRRSWRRRTADWALDNLRLARLGGHALRRSDSLHALAARLGFTRAPAATAPRVPFESRVYVRPSPAEVEHAWWMTEALIGRLARAAAAAGSELVLFYAPARHIIYGDICDELARAHDLPRAACDDRQTANRLIGIGERLGVPVIDPVPTFEVEARALEARGRHLYYPLDGHWNVDGHRLVAELLAAWILEQRAAPELQACAGPGEGPARGLEEPC